jgi:Fe2+ transport system protein FeoA
MKCQYCGKSFERSEALKSCEKCGKSGGCNLIRCPYCYSEFLQEPKIFSKIAALFMKKKKAKTDKCRILKLGEMDCGKSGKIVNILTDDILKRRKIMAMGLLPGITVMLLQKYPAIVIKSGESQVAIDGKLAELIEIEERA